jgi:hypothetical protein
VPGDIEDGFLSHGLPLREGEMRGITCLRLGADDFLLQELTPRAPILKKRTVSLVGYLGINRDAICTGAAR